MSTPGSHTRMFRLRDDCGDRDTDLPGCRYFAVRTDESHLSGWVSEAEYRWLCDRFGVTPPEKPEPEPRLYTHDSECCTFLGSFEQEADLYFCDQGGKQPTVIARYGSLGHQYTSGLIFADKSPWLAEAKKRAIALGLLTDETITGEQR